ncbi:MAG: ATP-dependent zinc metalloprotease FtsH [bacterium ADurb.Bin429]|nr:MAG: ATP-dependent zinc metalloprotease FtsH [bacterium ADurb.Bin429]
MRTAAALDEVLLWIGTAPPDDGTPHTGRTSGDAGSRHTDEVSVEERAARYTPMPPRWPMEALVVPQAVRDELLLAIETIQLETLVFDTWGLRAIEPFPRSALNFHGAPGTGKTLAAHGVATQLGAPILVASYAQIESMYHGEGPKNVEALFHAAQRDGAVLFIDEADSLLSRRLTHVTQGSEQAINSMRSQLLICLEQYRGVVIFATNLVANYDPAFETRVRHIHFPLPDVPAREAIWRIHLPSTLPLSGDVDIPALAQVEAEFCGRDIKNAVIDAALTVARHGRPQVTQQDLLDAIARIVTARNALRPAETPAPASPEMADRIRTAVAASDTTDTESVTVHL